MTRKKSIHKREKIRKGGREEGEEGGWKGGGGGGGGGGRDYIQSSHPSPKQYGNHLILLPVSEEVDRSVLSPLDDGPAALGLGLLAPRLQETVGTLWAQQVDPTGGLA